MTTLYCIMGGGIGFLLVAAWFPILGPTDIGLQIFNASLGSIFITISMVGFWIRNIKP